MDRSVPQRTVIMLAFLAPAWLDTLRRTA